MSWTIDFHPEARVEILEAYDWYAEQNRAAGDAFFVEVDRVIDSIAEAPQMWPRHIGGTHRCLLRRFPYAVIYRALPECVEIVAVAHQKRRPGYWRGR